MGFGWSSGSSLLVGGEGLGKQTVLFQSEREPMALQNSCDLRGFSRNRFIADRPYSFNAQPQAQLSSVLCPLSSVL